jgi:alcohol dehydrogenase class-P
LSFSYIGLGASINVAKPPKGSTVAVFGLGAVGLAVCAKLSFFLPSIRIRMFRWYLIALYISMIRLWKVQGLRIAGASRIIGVDLNPNRFEEGKPDHMPIIYAPD